MDQQQPDGDGEDPRLKPLMDYLEQHRRQINIEALRKQLIQSGHPPDLVAEAVRRVDPRAGAPPLPWLGIIGIFLANLIILPVLTLFLTDALVRAFAGLNNDLLWLIVPVLLLLGAPATQVAAGVRLRAGPRGRLGRALIWGAGFALGLFGLLLITFGICLVIFATSF